MPRTTSEHARHLTIPRQVLLQWDAEGNDRQLALDLFNAFGSKEKTLHASLGVRTSVPAFEAGPSGRFFAPSPELTGARAGRP